MRSNIARTESAGSVPDRAATAAYFDSSGLPEPVFTTPREPPPLLSEYRKLTSAVFLSSGMPANDGIGAVGFSSVRRIAPGCSLSPMSLRCGPGPSLPFSPILWQARQPDWAATSLPASYSGATFMSIEFGDPAAAPRYVRYPIAQMMKMPVIVAIGLRSGRRSGPRSMNGNAIRRIRQTVGIPIVATGTSTGGLITRRSSNRKKKYHSGRGTYVVVVGSAFGPSSAPNVSDMTMIDSSTTQAMTLSFVTA